MAYQIMPSTINEVRQKPRIASTLIVISLSILFTSNCFAVQEVPHTHDAITYIRSTDGYWQVWMKKADKPPQQLTSSPLDKRGPVWSPDGKKMLFRSNNRELYLFDVETKEEKQILHDIGWITDPSFITIEKIIFSRFDKNLSDESDLWISDLEGKQTELITKKSGLEYAPHASPDGKKIVFVSGKGFGTHEIHFFELDTKKETQLTHNRALEIHPVFSPDGKHIAYASDETGNFDIFVMNLETQKSIRLTDWRGADLYPSWSSDGTQIAFTSDRSGMLQVWTMDANGQNARLFTNENAASQEPSWQ